MYGLFCMNSSKCSILVSNNGFIFKENPIIIAKKKAKGKGIKKKDTRKKLLNKKQGKKKDPKKKYRKKKESKKKIKKPEAQARKKNKSSIPAGSVIDHTSKYNV